MSGFRNLRKNSVKANLKFAFLLVKDLPVNNLLIFLKFTRGAKTESTKKVYPSPNCVATFDCEYSQECKYFESKKQKKKEQKYERSLLSITLMVTKQVSSKRTKNISLGHLNIDTSQAVLSDKPLINSYNFQMATNKLNSINKPNKKKNKKKHAPKNPSLLIVMEANLINEESKISLNSFGPLLKNLNLKKEIEEIKKQLLGDSTKNEDLDEIDFNDFNDFTDLSTLPNENEKSQFKEKKKSPTTQVLSSQENFNEEEKNNSDDFILIDETFSQMKNNSRNKEANLLKAKEFSIEELNKAVNSLKNLIHKKKKKNDACHSELTRVGLKKKELTKIKLIFKEHKKKTKDLEMIIQQERLELFDKQENYQENWIEEIEKIGEQQRAKIRNLVIEKKKRIDNLKSVLSKIKINKGKIKRESKKEQMLIKETKEEFEILTDNVENIQFMIQEMKEEFNKMVFEKKEEIQRIEQEEIEQLNTENISLYEKNLEKTQMELNNVSNELKTNNNNNTNEKEELLTELKEEYDLLMSEGKEEINESIQIKKKKKKEMNLVREKKIEILKMMKTINETFKKEEEQQQKGIILQKRKIIRKINKELLKKNKQKQEYKNRIINNLNEKILFEKDQIQKKTKELNQKKHEFNQNILDKRKLLENNETNEQQFLQLKKKNEGIIQSSNNLIKELELRAKDKMVQINKLKNKKQEYERKTLLEKN
ncbi:hypothetical protein M0812_26071 [Anaeramoeba flamelloides]|uniref:C2 NT-type domain-containing protein n=1 Tax=Anaeramoeba flamelloides TaxID=1746091 RepID=A0AAV7YCN2_9EUKA|nr:hypothetical protein M0812_26071 [Anaeramoeba flamelloides]